MSVKNIRAWRANIKAIVSMEYNHYTKVKVTDGGDILLRNPLAPSGDFWRFEGNLSDAQVREEWSRFTVERMRGQLVEFESWSFNSKAEAMRKFKALLREDEDGQINILDRASWRTWKVRVSPGVDEHLIEYTWDFFGDKEVQHLADFQVKCLLPKYHRVSIQKVDAL